MKMAPWLGLLALLARPFARDGDAASTDAWQAWAAGDVSRTEALSRDVPGDEGKHLRFLVASVTGRYEDAVALHGSIAPSYRRYAELDAPLVEAYRHLGRWSDAASFARQRRLDQKTIAALSLQSERPLAASLQDLAVIPFADHELTPYFPAFSVEINGKALIAHLDTGGAHLVMSPARARELGIQLLDLGRGFHGVNKTELKGGLARSLRLGAASLENLPVMTLATLTGTQDFVVFGTSVLERFLATVDYPRGRLLLSPRGDAASRERHERLLSGPATEVPFFLWEDHYLFARGGVGDRRDLNFFVDSGLVLLHDDGKGGVKQPAFQARANDLVAWGVPRAVTKQGFFDSPLPLSLGALTRAGLVVNVENRPSWASFGGVRIDGQLSHAFLSRYSWTLDFDRRVFVFRE